MGQTYIAIVVLNISSEVHLSLKVTKFHRISIQHLLLSKSSSFMLVNGCSFHHFSLL